MALNDNFPIFNGVIEEDGPVRFARDLRDEHSRAIHQTRGAGHFPYGAKTHSKHWFHEGRDKLDYHRDALVTEAPPTTHDARYFGPTQLNRLGRHSDYAQQQRDLRIGQGQAVVDVGGWAPIRVRDDQHAIDDVMDRDATRFVKQDVALEDMQVPIDFFVTGMRGRAPDVEAARRVKHRLELRKERTAEEKVGDGARGQAINAELPGTVNWRNLGGMPEGLVRNPIEEDLHINNVNVRIPNEAQGRFDSISRIERSWDLVNFPTVEAVGGRAWRTYQN